ncbi:hypothetical protein ASPCADRAFT_129830 [Aspergillus carbonarius ITEM 5010]|uniref:Uncharacterized protein n=1 Tax=Aspergillus carbonarius (strain ITEM 5010) TaxID=602072 RepID=A0A1R3RQK2_ASPC5|nr:hypothetical protein ASPCADRAFT_129830 [Aspergillus carbonarius ITEM 5010]
MHFPSPSTLTLTLPLLLTTTTLLPSISADDLELTPSDIPTPCWPVCGETVGITESCYHQYHHLSSSSQELSCICNWAEAPTLLPLCEACIANHRSEKGDSDVHDNEAYEILTSCSLSTTTWNPAAATSILSAENNTASATTTASSSENASVMVYMYGTSHPSPTNHSLPIVLVSSVQKALSMFWTYMTPF